MCRLPPSEHTVLNTDSLCFTSDTWIGGGRSHLTLHKWAKALQLDLAMGPKAGIKWRGLPNKGWLKSLLSYIWNAQSG